MFAAVTDTPLRVAIFSEVYWPMVSGVGVTLRRLAESLAARGHAVRIYAPTYPRPGGAPDRAEVHRSPSLPFFVYPDVQWAFPRAGDIRADAELFRPDVIHVATEFAMGLAGVRLAKRLNVPAVASAHTNYDMYAGRYGLDWIRSAGWRYLRWFYGQCNVVLAPSEFYRAHLQQRGVARTALWTRGVDTEAFNPAHRSDAYRASFGVGPDDLLVTYVGRLAREKNLELLLEAWRRLGARAGSAKLVLVGRGPLAESIARQAIPGVQLAGLREGADLSAAYASADVFAFPSATETFGNVLIEAMASGLPSVAAEAGGVLEFARQEDNALLVPAGDAGALAAALERLLHDAALRQRLAAGARRTAGERRWDVIDDRLIADYRVVVAAGRVVGG